ncbi:hypothetical protein [Phocaeicola fibrisolvens]|jgi:hypothetical protein|uniref:hypothetical protein n=1 Tax=Phocaeicola fibrisolvens TaxID=2981793 RepID=UPI0011DDE7B6|nr:hypothetical protein [Phocaeicola fibrisolvens]MBM6654074.1 hypothetical protein [Bacteroides mediterraneensis]MCU6777836.1 hypothetical protein [Phocaeicola fibrisolvens]
MKKQFFLMWAMAVVSTGVMAQKKDFGYKFYGQVRTDLFYNSRSNSETVDGLFYMYPKDMAPDADGKDLNAKPDGNFYTLYTRLGVDVTGPMWGKAKTSAKVEIDFRGSGTTYSLIRIRHAYFNLDWGKSALLVGQTWHPLYGDVSPDILNLNMGAPYQPFSRAPQVRYRLTEKHFVLTAAAVWQSQYLSVGPSSNQAGATTTQKNQSFIKNGCMPEFYLGMDYKRPGLLAGAGVHVASITPRTQSEYDGKTYKVSERITGVSAEAHVKYTHQRFLLAAKSVLGSNLTQASTIGGYGITSTDSRTGEQEYTPVRVSHTWLNMMYGSTFRGGIFAGYLKNLGASKEVTGVLGTGTDIDQLNTLGAEFTYNRPNWKIGAEYTWTGAWYGDYTAKARVTNTHLVKNNRIVFTALFQF